MAVNPPEITIEIDAQAYLTACLQQIAHLFDKVRVHPVQQQALNNTKRPEETIKNNHTTNK